MPHHEEHEEIEGQRECLQEPARTQLLHPVDVPESQEDAMAAYTGSMPDYNDTADETPFHGTDAKTGEALDEDKPKPSSKSKAKAKK